jgi:AcrR family transcriptional regulator
MAFLLFVKHSSKSHNIQLLLKNATISAVYALNKGGKSVEKVQDKRTERTCRALIDAVYILLETYRWEEITVLKLCETAGVKRATFYLHFKDINQFLDYCNTKMFHDLFPPIHQDAPPTTREDYVEGLFNSIFVFLEEHRDMLKLNIERTKSNKLLDLMHTAIAGELNARGKAIVTRGYTLHAPAPIICEYYAGAYMAVIKYWLLNETEFTKEDLISSVKLLINQKEMSFIPPAK